MKQLRFVLSALLVVCLAAVPLAGCTTEEPEEGPFSYSDGLDENGFWEGIRALDYVEDLTYEGLEIPNDVHSINSADVQAQIESITSTYATSTEIMDRAVENGDTLNIDYVGSVDGVEFEGGSTEGAGSEVTIGETSFVDDFLEQLIGHTPGENFDIEVTFPEDYSNDQVKGKDAVFNVTINAIIEKTPPEITDAFVAENLSSIYGWTTVAEMEDGLLADLQESALFTYVQEYLTYDTNVTSVPDKLITYQENALVSYYETYAEMYGVELDEFLTSYMSLTGGVDELIENSAEDIEYSAHYSLSVQAVAEDAGIQVTDEDLAAYFLENFGSEDTSTYEEEYGRPYLKQIVLGQLVIDHIVESAKLQ